MKKSILLLSMLAVLVSCNGNKKMETTSTTVVDSTVVSKNDMLEKNKATALAAEDAFNSHDVNALMMYVADDAVDYGDASMEPIKGKEAISKNLQSYFSAFPDVKGTHTVVLSEGNHVAVFSEYQGTNKGEMMGMKPTGKSVKFNDADLFTFNDEGKITEHRAVQNFGNVMMQSTMKK